MDPGSSIERAVHFTVKKAQQFPQVLWAKRGVCDKHLRGFDPACPLPLLHFSS